MPREIGDVIEAIYAAAEASAPWADALEAVRDVMAGHLAALFYRDATTVNPGDFVALRGYPASAVDDFVSYFAARDVRASTVDALAPGVVYVDDRDLPFAQIKNSEIVSDFFRPLGAGHAIGTRLFDGGPRGGVISVFSPVDSGAFSDEQVRTFEILVPHLLRALRLHRQMQQSRIMFGALRDSLDRFDTPVFLLRADCSVANANGAAEALARRPGSPLQIVLGRLSLQDAAAAQLVRAAVRQTAAMRRPAELVRVPRRNGMPLGLMLSPSNGLVLAFVADPSARIDADPHVLISLFGLTATEAKAALGVAAGLSPSAIAQVRGVSVETVRAQLKAVMSKMGLNSQVQIAGVVCRVAKTL